MLRNMFLVSISIFSINAFADSYFVKYNDLIKETTVTEKFTNSEDLANRLEELKYVNEQSVLILNSGINNLNPRSNRPTISSFRSGGEGVGN